jgi:predicted ATPase
MIESIEFTNFKALRSTTLPLTPFTLLLGPNGSGKSTVLLEIQITASLAALPLGNRPEIVGKKGWSSLLERFTLGLRTGVK